MLSRYTGTGSDPTSSKKTVDLVTNVTLAGVTTALLVRMVLQAWKKKETFFSFAYIVKLAATGRGPRTSDGKFYGGPVCAVKKLPLPEPRKEVRTINDRTFFSLQNWLSSKNWRHLLWLEWNRVCNVMKFPNTWLYEGGPLQHVRTSAQIQSMAEEMNKKFEETGVPVKDLLLVGGGHSHVHVLKMLAMKPLQNTRVTLISKTCLTPYSGMLPGHVGGMYTKEEAHLDLFRLARFARVRFIVAEVDHIDFVGKKVHFKTTAPLGSGGRSSARNALDIEMFERVRPASAPGSPASSKQESKADIIVGSPGGVVPSAGEPTTLLPDEKSNYRMFTRKIRKQNLSSMLDVNPAQAEINPTSTRPPLAFDVISVNVGSVPDKPAFANTNGVTAVKPIDGLSVAWEEILQKVTATSSQSSTPTKICIVGGGAAGVEMAFASNRRLKEVIAERQVELRGGGGVVNSKNNYMIKGNDTSPQLQMLKTNSASASWVSTTSSTIPASKSTTSPNSRALTSSSSPSLPPGIEISLIHAGKQLLPGHGAPARQLVQELLEEQGVKVLTNRPIKDAVSAWSSTNRRNEKFLVAGDNGVKNKEKIPFDYCIWCTGGLPPKFLVDSLELAGLEKDTDGTMLVSNSMQSTTNPDVFGAGDCVTIKGYKRPKAGVFAVMAGMTLFNNLKLHCEMKSGSVATPLNPTSLPPPPPQYESYKPQTEWLGLLNLCDGTAMASRGDDLAIRAAWLFQLKDWIDRKWMCQYSEDGLPRMLPDAETDPIFASLLLPNGAKTSTTTSERIALYLSLHDRQAIDPTMRCGGCACKLGGKVLAKGLEQLPSSTAAKTTETEAKQAAPFGKVTEGAGDDCAVVELAAGDVRTIHTVDYFKAGVLDMDPFVFGQVAALHSLSDVIAMGVVNTDSASSSTRSSGSSPSSFLTSSSSKGQQKTHISALSTCSVPLGAERLQQQDLAMMLAGAKSAFGPDTPIVGGHTIEGDLSLGFTVNAAQSMSANPSSTCWLKGVVKENDVLVVTKPLGTGIIQAGVMRNCCSGDVWQNCLKSMLATNSADVVRILQRIVADNKPGKFAVSACTDITGFGLLGHLLEMTRKTNRNLQVQLDMHKIPILHGALQMVAEGVASSLFPKNLALVAHEIENLKLSGAGEHQAFGQIVPGGAVAGVETNTKTTKLATPDFALIDPQTSGGLLLALPESLAGELAKEADVFVIGKIAFVDTIDKRVKLQW
ncbi:unnamed protein product [Amoebophrya sp. A120]|nr:unnamed protein product [Amoebophrya sp. A120]|eukprot:GSA120T00018245001.1